MEDADHSVPHKVGRLCERVAKKKGGGSVINVSKEKLLEASLLSLQTLGRQHRPIDVSASLESDCNDGGNHCTSPFSTSCDVITRTRIQPINKIAHGSNQLKIPILFILISN